MKRNAYILPVTEIKLLLSALLLYSGLVASIWMLYDQDNINAIVIHLELASVISFYYYWRMAPWGVARYTSFGAALLVFCMLFRLIAVIDTIVYGVDYFDSDRWPPTLPVYDSFGWLFMEGEGITQLGFLLTITTWRIAVASTLDGLSLRTLTFPAKSKATLLKIYYAALGITGLLRISHIDLGGLSQLVSGVIFIGIAAIYLYAASRDNRWRRASMALILALPFCMAAMNSGSKEAIFLPLVPGFMIIWRDFRRIWMRVAMVVAALGMFAIGQLYIHYVRTNLWSSGQTESPAQIAQAVYDSINSESFAEAMEGSLSRTNYAMIHAITMAVVARHGFSFTEVYGSLPTVFIPRLLWPDKPSIMPAAAHTRRILGTSKELSEMTSATAAGLYAEMYLGGGYFIMMLSAILYGVLVGNVQKWVFNRLPPIATLLLTYHLFYTAIRFDESFVMYIYNGLILFAVSLWLTMRWLYPEWQKQPSIKFHHA